MLLLYRFLPVYYQLAPAHTYFSLQDGDSLHYVISVTYLLHGAGSFLRS